jgi:acyl-CoA synthetase (AMP-forming)/AMP-acid ligase II
MMGYDTLKLTALAALFLGLVVAVPLAPASANEAKDTVSTSAPIALPAQAAADKTIVVADNKYKKAYKQQKNWNKNYYKNNKVVVVKPSYRKWYHRPYYGTVIGGVALGAMLGAAAYAAGPPAPNLCWYWADPYQTQGYWDYCY